MSELHISFFIFKASRLVRLNKEGTLLAVNSGDNKIKILVSVNGLPLLEINERVPPVPDIIPKVSFVMKPLLTVLCGGKVLSNASLFHMT